MSSSQRHLNADVDLCVISHHRGPQVFMGWEVSSGTSEASSIWQLSRKPHQTLIASDDEPEESRPGRAEAVIAAPACGPQRRTYVTCMCVSSRCP